MNKKELTLNLSRRIGFPPQYCEFLLGNVLDIISEALEGEERVCIHDFGSFIPWMQTTRPVRNPRTGEEMALTPRLSVKFHPGKKLQLQLNKKKDSTPLK